MRIALTYTPQTTSFAAEADLDGPSTIDAIEAALRRAGHDVERIGVTRPLSLTITRLEEFAPDFIFNRARGSSDRSRGTFFPALFDELGIPYTTIEEHDPALRPALDRPSELDDVIHAIVREAIGLRGLSCESDAPQPPRSKPSPLRVGLTYNMKRVTNEAEAEFDSPRTIQAICSAIESFGHSVVQLEAKPELPHRLLATKPDVVFNIAEGIRGRGREAQVPALLELLGIPYSGSDSTTMSLCLDKGLTKQILRAAKIDTPDWQVLVTGREKLKTLRYPVIVKPNAEGTSKGITSASVVHDEPAAIAAAQLLIERYRQPALVEEYIAGREFTVGLLGDRRLRVLPPMEIVFLKGDATPVYGFEEKQAWMDYMRWDCPANLTPVELERIETIARNTFFALHCRDVARIDLRMAHDGTVYVIECNPLPGLAPDYSDLSNIAKAVSMDYRTLIAEILAGCIARSHGENTPT